MERNEKECHLPGAFLYMRGCLALRDRTGASDPRERPDHSKKKLAAGAYKHGRCAAAAVEATLQRRTCAPSLISCGVKNHAPTSTFGRNSSHSPQTAPPLNSNSFCARATQLIFFGCGLPTAAVTLFLAGAAVSPFADDARRHHCSAPTSLSPMLLAGGNALSTRAWPEYRRLRHRP